MKLLKCVVFNFTRNTLMNINIMNIIVYRFTLPKSSLFSMTMWCENISVGFIYLLLIPSVMRENNLTCLFDSPLILLLFIHMIIIRIND